MLVPEDFITSGVERSGGTEPTMSRTQKALDVCIFKSEAEAIENAAFLAGFRSDVDRAYISAQLHDGKAWRSGRAAPKPNGKGNLHVFQVSNPEETSNVSTFALEQYRKGYCLWCLDQYKNGAIHVVKTPMEDLEDWDDRNEVVYAFSHEEEDAIPN